MRTRLGRHIVMRLSLARAWRTDLPRVVLLLQAGNAFSWFGYGLILPFEIIYLHQVRGFSTATAGLVLGATLGSGTIVTLPSGVLLDRFRAKPILIAAVLASAVREGSGPVLRARRFVLLAPVTLILLVVG